MHNAPPIVAPRTNFPSNTAVFDFTIEQCPST